MLVQCPKMVSQNQAHNSLILHADLCATVLTEKAYDTVGQPPSTEIGVPNMPSLKAKKAEQPPQENVLLEP